MQVKMWSPRTRNENPVEQLSQRTSQSRPEDGWKAEAWTD